MGADMDRYLAPCGGSANGVIGYLASSTFSGGVCVSTLQNSDFQQLYVPCNEASSGTPVAGYMASSSFSGSVSAYTFMDASMETYYTTSGSTGAAGYLASSSGTYGGTITYTCNAGDTLSGTTCTHTYTASATYACKAGDTLTGTTCYHNALNQASPNCPNGTMDFTNHVCYAADTFQCPTGMTYDSAANLCSEAATCSNGVLDPVKNVCYQGSSASCSAPWALDTSNDVCYSPPVCQNGAFVASAGDCQATVTQNCGAYTWNAVENKCIQAVTCPKDPSFSQNATIAFSSTLSECVSQAEHDCIAQTSYTGLPVEMCQAVPVCSGSGVYDPVQHTCNMGTSCPLGAQYTCMSYNGTLQCSANQCFNPANPPGGQTIDNGSTSMYTNDAQNPDGSCAGQILIFNGMPSRCRPPGLTVGELNNCCASSQVMAENVGDTFDAYGAYQTLATMWDMAEVGYYSYLASQGLITSTSFAATGGLTIEGSTLAGEAFSTTISGAATETGVIAGTQAGSTVTATAAVTSGEEAYLGAMLNPATIVVAIIVMIVMKVLMGGGCDNRDIQCGESVASKDCHYVGDYCEKHWFFGCVQSAKGYCCFNSMMARIIQEQGRPQLTAFGPTGDWGAPDNPNCVGFTPEQFEAIDFSKIDFSEYISSVIQQDVTQTNVTNAQTTIQANIQNTLSNQQSKP
jgi:conjugal transfer mating pair stabilization protein TraN